MYQKRMNFHHRSAMLVLIKLFFVHFGHFPLLAMLEFQTAYIIRKPFASILFFDIIVEILTYPNRKTNKM
jgi:hypothetical protein